MPPTNGAVLEIVVENIDPRGGSSGTCVNWARAEAWIGAPRRVVSFADNK